MEPENPPKTAERFPFSTPRPPGLTERAAKFAECYALTGKAKSAAIEAGYSERNAHIQATQLRKRENVRAYIECLQTELANGAGNVPGSAAWIRARYIAIASVSPADLMVTDSVTGRLRWKLPAELTDIQRAAVADVVTRARLPAKSRAARPSGRKGAALEPSADNEADDSIAAGGDPNGAAVEVVGYKLHSAAGALDALAKVAGMYRPDTTPAPTVNMRGIFQIVAAAEATSETSARLRSQHGAAGARIIDAPADVRPLARLRGV